MTRRYTGAAALTLLLALGVLALGALSASATTSGHFTSDSPSGKTNLDMTGTTGGAHDAKLTAFGVVLTCHNLKYTLSPLTTQTTMSITGFPEFVNCTTSNGDAITVKMNGCHFDVTPASSGHGTPHLRCPTGQKIEVTVPTGLMKFGAQTPTKGGLTYTTTVVNGKHEVTVNITVEGIHGECHGVCQIFGTSSSSVAMAGSGTVAGTDAVTGSAVNITAT
jgi:hypothetical protein